jgi:hypothetical protein
MAAAAGGSTERVKDRLGCDVGDGVKSKLKKQTLG